MTAHGFQPGQAVSRARNAPGHAHYSSDDVTSIVVWSLFIAVVFLLPVAGIFAIKQFE